ncbi:phosphatidate cytidylyltransferase [Azospirillum halopraeferens]|uniref:phosphatidate cytidylyltransferase n=1 Tax=Azospirillum halopraeferens TaxID=34010 RepID=UPI00048C97E8|nr:phosphatidate cytidylyltransferase [Azospirillum halopraeferens]
MKSSTGGNAGSAPPPPEAGKASDLKVRMLSALILGPLVLAAVWAGGWTLRALLAATALLALNEWLRMVAQDRLATALPAGLAAVIVVLGVHVALGPAIAMLAAFALAGVVTATAGMGRWLVGFGVPYVAAGVLALDWLREAPEAGLALFLFVLLTVWATDIGAYAAGRSIGGPRLAPRISPKKTWAGLLGGVVASGLAGLGVAVAAGAASPLLALLVGACTAVVAQAGDLFESAVKRRFDIKDSGRLIPGHGGLLDRIDGLLVAAPVLALFHATAGVWLRWW